MGFSRQEYWTGLPFPPPGDLSDPGNESTSSALTGGFFTTGSPEKPNSYFFDILCPIPFSLGLAGTMDIWILKQFFFKGSSWQTVTWPYTCVKSLQKSLKTYTKQGAWLPDWVAKQEAPLWQKSMDMQDSSVWRRHNLTLSVLRELGCVFSRHWICKTPVSGEDTT